MQSFAFNCQSTPEKLYVAAKACSKVSLTYPSQNGVLPRPVSLSLGSIPLNTRPLLTDSADHHGGGRTDGIRAGN